MADVFISYNKGSAGKLVKQIADALEAAGISCWYMGRDSRRGRFPEIIAREIENCAVFLLVLNEESNRSKHVQNEVSLAFENDKELLPFHVDNCKLSHYMRYYLNSFTIVNANPPTKQRIEELIAEVADTLGKGSLRTESHIAPPQRQESAERAVIVAEDSFFDKITITEGHSPDDKAPSSKIIERGSCGDNITYTLDENGVLTISGTGNMNGYSGVDIYAPWWAKRNIISFAHIESGITSIGYGAFFDCPTLIDAVLPDSVIYIEELAFYHCANLAHVSIPDSVKDIAVNAFGACISLKSVSVPKNAEIRGAFPNWTEVIRRK